MSRLFVVYRTAHAEGWRLRSAPYSLEAGWGLQSDVMPNSTHVRSTAPEPLMAKRADDAPQMACRWAEVAGRGGGRGREGSGWWVDGGMLWVVGASGRAVGGGRAVVGSGWRVVGGWVGGEGRRWWVVSAGESARPGSQLIPLRIHFP